MCAGAAFSGYEKKTIMSQKIPNNMCNLSIFYLGFLAQSVEHAAVNRSVVGSSPT